MRLLLIIISFLFVAPVHAVIFISGGAVTPPAGGAPTVASSTSSNVADNVTDHTVALPSGISSGDLLLAFFCVDAGETPSWPGDWTVIAHDANGSSTSDIAYKIASGSEGSSITVTTTEEMSAHAVYRITGDDGNEPEVSAVNSGTDTNPDPSSLTPSGGSNNYLWIAFECNDDGRGDVTAYPTGYDDNQIAVKSGDVFNGVQMGVATKAEEDSSDDPGTFTIDQSEYWDAWTVSVSP